MLNGSVYIVSYVSDGDMN